MITVGLKEETIIKIIEECIKPLSGLKNGFEKQENRADEIAENLPPEKYPSVSAVIAFVKNKIELFSEAVGKVYLKATDFEDYKTDASNTYATKTDVENFENNVADTYATKTDVENFENNVAETYATKTDVEDFENNVAETYATKTDVENLKTDTEVIATVTGKAITINPANAPIPQLILRGETTQDGTPTPDAPIELKSVGDSGSFNMGMYGKNLIPYPYKDTTKTENGITWTDNGDGTITADGIATENSSFLLHSYSMPLVKGVYTISGVPANAGYSTYMIQTATDEGFAFNNTIATGETFTLDKDTKTMIVAVVVWKGCTINNLVFKPQIELGTVATPYEKGNKQTFTNNDTLRGVGDIADVKDFARGMKTQRFGVVDLGTLNWYEQEAYKGCFHAQILGMSQKWSKGICSCYPFGDDVFTWLMANACADNTLYRAENDYVYIKDLSFPDATAFKSAMNGKYFVYELETPIETPLTETELNAYRQLYTNKGNTTILSEVDMEISYYVNKPNAQAIGSLHEQINKDYFKLQQAIISTGGN